MADLLTEVTEGVGVMTMNRPERRNALSDEMVAAIGDALAAWDADPHVGAIVLTGAGTAFCAGGDVVDFASRGGLNNGRSEVDPERVAWLRACQQSSVGALAACGTPTIAAVPGAAAGAGLGLALACDLRIGTQDSLFTTAFAGVGLSGDYGVTWHLTRLIGPARARQMLFFGDRVTGEQALAWGLVNWLVEPEELRDQALAIAARLATGPRFAVSQMKRNLAVAAATDLTASLEHEATTQVESAATADHREAVTAFVERRPPAFGGG
ncbi:enoyl-CoA hydratase-related protein [Propionicicella superfundia]|uniref:enoyl-CoA hydratase-related protein n=1 Tax=Propionicicella superfundia TaxID=348582 RepID=UPI00041AEEF3|nr:enoyl-CoA hydratase-related protein [Propionicicella superfundia]